MSGQKPGGVGQYFEDGMLIREMYASTCSHCGTITEFISMRTMMDHVEICRGCMKLICLQCAGGPCRPLEKEVDRTEQEAELRRRMQLAGWGCY